MRTDPSTPAVTPAAKPGVQHRGHRQWVTLQDRLLLAIALLSAVAALVVASLSTHFALNQLALEAQAQGSLTPEALAKAAPSVFRGVGGIVLAAIAILLPSIYLLISRAFAPVRRLSLAAQNVANGRFETVDIRPGDALGRLAESFNHMVHRIAEQKSVADDANAKLIEANLNLERKVIDRTAAITAASQRLKSEIAEKEDFLRAVSHDLNAPLRNIDGMVTMLKRKHGEALPEEVVRRLDRIKYNVGVETELIGEILELSRIKTRRDDPEPINLQELIWDLRGLFENDLREHRIELLLESQLPTLLAEKARIRQVFQNLVDNAIKYMGEGPERRIAIGCFLRPEEATFWVRDTGIGISPENVEKVFYVFRRGTNHTGVAGKGVGLASVKSIIENYQGTIWVEPNADGGSTFKFTINGQYLKNDVRVFRRPADPAEASAETTPGTPTDADADEAPPSSLPTVPNQRAA